MGSGGDGIEDDQGWGRGVENVGVRVLGLKELRTGGLGPERVRVGGVRVAGGWGRGGWDRGVGVKGVGDGSWGWRGLGSKGVRVGVERG